MRQYPCMLSLTTTTTLGWWSYIETAAVMIGNDILEIKGGVDDRQYWVNGQLGHRFITSRNLFFTIGGFGGRFRAKNDHIIQYKIFLPNDQVLLIRSIKDMLRVELDNTNADDFGNCLGLMGTYGAGQLMARNGTTVFESNNTDAFSKEWQVMPSDPQLFHSVDGPQYPEQCRMPKPLQNKQQRRLASSISQEDAELACNHVLIKGHPEFNSCVLDVVTTGDVQVADGYE